MAAAPLTIRDIRAAPVSVPMKLPLGTSAATIREAPLLLIDLWTEEGVIGRAYVFCYMRGIGPAAAQILAQALEFIKGDALEPLTIQAKLNKRFRLIGAQGLVRMAMAGIDVAAWDALAIANDMPLARMLGASLDPIPAYNSNGLRLMPPKVAAEEAIALLEGGFRAVKLRLGYPTLAEDLARVRAVRDRLPEGTALMVDFNQALTLAEAKHRCRALDGEGVYWIEEPIRHNDYIGNAELTAETATPIQIGENFSGPLAMAEALDARACDYVMPDLERIFGVTGWLQASGLAAARGIEMSSHLYSEVSCHLLAATPTAHWLEYADWAAPVLQEPLEIKDGHAIIPDRPGTGVIWDEAAIAHYRAD
jgi:mandelate racemase